MQQTVENLHSSAMQHKTRTNKQNIKQMEHNKAENDIYRGNIDSLHNALLQESYLLLTIIDLLKIIVSLGNLQPASRAYSSFVVGGCSSASVLNSLNRTRSVRTVLIDVYVLYRLHRLIVNTSQYYRHLSRRLSTTVSWRLSCVLIYKSNY